MRRFLVDDQKVIGKPLINRDRMPILLNRSASPKRVPGSSKGQPQRSLRPVVKKSRSGRLFGRLDPKAGHFAIRIQRPLNVEDEVPFGKGSLSKIDGGIGDSLLIENVRLIAELRSDLLLERSEILLCPQRAAELRSHASPELGRLTLVEQRGELPAMLESRRQIRRSTAWNGRDPARRRRLATPERRRSTQDRETRFHVCNVLRAAI